MIDTSMPMQQSCGPMQVPVSNLSIDGTTPAEGDQVSFTVDGKVTSVDSDYATVTPEKINGEDVETGEQQGAPDESESLDQMGNRIRSQMDNGY